MTTLKRGKFLIILLISTVVLAFLVANSTADEHQQSLLNKSELVVLMDINTPGYFEIAGENFGYQYDLLKSYTDDHNLDLRIVQADTSSESAALLERSMADMVVTLEPEMDGARNTIHIYNTSYVVMAPRAEARHFTRHTPFSTNTSLANKRLLISSGFCSTKEYGALMDSLDSSTEVFLSSRSGMELVGMLKEGKYDFLICEKSEAQLSSALINGVTKVYHFSDQIAVNVAINKRVKGLSKSFSHWLDEYRGGEEYASLNAIYLERGIVRLIQTKAPNQRLRNGISVYDSVMRTVSEREGFDWRLMSAIAYSESRFNAHVVSHRGARGLMQIMPATARQFDVSQEDVMKPEVNIMVATQLLDRIESMLKLPSEIEDHDRMSLILASYNCGIGHVMDAQRLATKYGGNANLWSDVSLFLKRKSESQYSSDVVVRSGRFSGSRQTLAFVSDVMGRYTDYCSTTKR